MADQLKAQFWYCTG